MRKLAQELGVVPMALYKHVSNKDELLDGLERLRETAGSSRAAVMWGRTGPGPPDAQ